MSDNDTDTNPLETDSPNTGFKICLGISVCSTFFAGKNNGFFGVVNVATYKVILTFQLPYLPCDMGGVHNSVS